MQSDVSWGRCIAEETLYVEDEGVPGLELSGERTEEEPLSNVLVLHARDSTRAMVGRRLYRG